MPAAVLFATVFTVGALGRNSELTAAKAGGQSFHRISAAALPLGVVRGLPRRRGRRLSPGATARQLELQKSRLSSPRRHGAISFIAPTRDGSTPSVPRRSESLVAPGGAGAAGHRSRISRPRGTADSATYEDSLGKWRVWSGTSRIFAGEGVEQEYRFKSMQLRALRQNPADLLVEPKSPEEMRYARTHPVHRCAEAIGKRCQQARGGPGPSKSHFRQPAW